MLDSGTLATAKAAGDAETKSVDQNSSEAAPPTGVVPAGATSKNESSLVAPCEVAAGAVEAAGDRIEAKSAQSSSLI